MNLKPTLAIPVCLFGVFVFYISGSTGQYISNLSDACFRCLCHVWTQCDMSHGCTGGYCGPFNISKIYWKEAGRIVLEDDDPDRNHAWEDCVRSYHCARRVIENYILLFAKDCNGDGVTDCFDYMMINANGGYSCSEPLNRSEIGRLKLRRYQDCRF